MRKRRSGTAFLAALAVIVATAATWPATASDVSSADAEPPLEVALGEPEHLGDGVTQSMAMTTAFGTGPDGGVEQYVGLTGSPAVFAVVDPFTGERLFAEPVPSSDVIWAMAQGSDGNVYFSGTSDSKLYRYLPAERRVEVVGANPSAAFVWDLGASSDGKIYGATYPEARVFEYDIASDTFEDLGSMMEGQKYARGIEVTDQYLYVGVGVDKALVRYDRTTGAKESIPVPTEGGASTISEIEAIGDRLFVHSGSVLHVLDSATHELLYSGRSDRRISPPSPHNPDLVYFKDANDFLTTYDMSTDTAERVPGVPALSDGSIRAFDWVQDADGGAVLTGMSAFTENYHFDPTTGHLDVVTPDVPDQPVAINVLSADGGSVYVGGYQRGMSIFDESTGKPTRRATRFHQPEGIGHLDGVTYFGTYGGARMYRYDPSLPYDYSENGPGNPGLALDIGQEQDRPFAIQAADGKLFIGTIPTYGKLGGALTIVEERRSADGTLRKLHSETIRNIVPEQAITGLAYRDGLVYGSTTISGGLGVEPTADEAKIFVYDIRTQRKKADFTIDLPGVDVPLEIIGELTFGPDGLLWGAADGTIFALDPHTHEVVKSKEVYPTEFDSSLFRPIYLEWGPDGYLYTTLGRHLVVVDPETLRAKELARNVHVMALGEEGDIYYRQDGSQLYRLPRTDISGGQP